MRDVADCFSVLLREGTDRYGRTNAPILVSILDVETRQCPSNPAALDEAWRVVRASAVIRREQTLPICRR